MRVTYRVTAEDFVSAQRLHRKKGLPLWRRSFRWVLSAVLLGVVGVNVAGWISTKDPIFIANFKPMLIVCTGWIAAIWILPQYLWRRNFNKDPQLQQEVTAEISDKGIHLIGPNSDSHIAWAAFRRYLESDTIFMLYQTNQIINILPKRFFEPSEAQHFHDLLAAKLGETRALQSHYN